MQNLNTMNTMKKWLKPGVSKEKETVQGDGSKEKENAPPAGSLHRHDSQRGSSKRGRPISGVWEYFQPQGSDPVALCTIPNCRARSRKVTRGAEGSRPTSWGTSAFWSHLNVHHPEQYEAAREAQKKAKDAKKKTLEKAQDENNVFVLKDQPNIDEVFQNTKKWNKENKNQKKISENLLTWIIDAMEPYTTLDNERFKVLISSLEPKFNLPSSKVVRTSIDPLYRKIQFNLSIELKKDIVHGYAITIAICNYHGHLV